MKNRTRAALAVTAGVMLTAMTGCVFGKQNALNEMAAVTKERTKLIDEFVKSYEQTLTQYTKEPGITDMLHDPDNKELAESVQAYTESYSQSIENNDGIYVGTLETKILTHTEPSVIGIITRNDPDVRKALFDNVLSAGEDVYNAGIIRSPRTGSQTLSLYKSIFDADENLIGYAGFAVKTDKLEAELNDVSVSGVKEADFKMFSVSDSRYIFTPDPEQIGTITTNEDIQKLCGTLCGKTDAADGTLEYQDDSGKYFSAYSYMPEYGWLLMLSAKG